MNKGSTMEMDDEEPGTMEVAAKTDSIGENNLDSSRPNPLLMEDILDKIFVYFRDKPNLCSFRQVSKIWKKSSGRTVKKNLVWKIGPSTAREIEFMEVMSNCSDDVFQNFHWAATKRTFSTSFPAVEDYMISQHVVESFLSKFGSKIVTLRLSGKHPSFVESRLRSDLLPNLERLEIYHLSEAILNRTQPFSGIKNFPKLKRLHFSTDVYPYNGVDFNNENANGRICLDIIEACSNTLRSFRTNLSGTVSDLLKRQVPSLECLNTTSRLEIGWVENLKVVLESTALKNLTANFHNLKHLHVPIPVEVPEQEVYDMLSKCATKLEKIHICICERDEQFEEEGGNEAVADAVEAVDAENAVEPADDGIVNQEIEVNNNNKDDTPILIPSFPRLKNAILHNWKLHKNVDFFAKMPNLSSLELHLFDGLLLTSTPPPSVHTNLRSLKYHQHPGSIDEDTVRVLAMAFPNLKELQVEVANDEVLTAIFTNMPELKTLNLDESTITDCGITGLTKLEMQSAFENNVCLVEVDDIRRNPCIGNLQGLQDFQYNGTNLTKFSLYFGIAKLHDLRRLTFPCHREEVSVDDKKSYLVHPIDVGPLITHCKYLSKLNVKYSTIIYEDAVEEAERLAHNSVASSSSDASMSTEADDADPANGSTSTADGAHDSQDESADDGSGSTASDDSHTCAHCPLCTKFFRGSQITAESIELLRDAFPYLELHYDFTEN